jgi:hypothetical protein
MPCSPRPDLKSTNTSFLEIPRTSSITLNHDAILEGPGYLWGIQRREPEPVFGIVKSVLGFRQFLLLGLDNVRGEWSLVTMAWNVKRMFALKAA